MLESKRREAAVLRATGLLPRLFRFGAVRDKAGMRPASSTDIGFEVAKPSPAACDFAKGAES